MARTKKEAPKESEESRREFITKLVTTAGAVAAAGLLAGAASDPAAGAELTKIHKTTGNGTALLKYDKHVNGFRLTMSGPDLGRGLRQMGIVIEDKPLPNAQLIIEFTY